MRRQFEQQSDVGVARDKKISGRFPCPLDIDICRDRRGYHLPIRRPR